LFRKIKAVDLEIFYVDVYHLTMQFAGDTGEWSEPMIMTQFTTRDYDNFRLGGFFGLAGFIGTIIGSVIGYLIAKS
jgi:hypothetical protein